MKKTLIFGGLQLFIIFLVTLYVESVSSGELLLTENILASDFRETIINNPIKVLIILGFFNVLFYYLSHKTRQNKELVNMYNNICQLVFDQYIKPNSTLENSKFRVSLFKAQKGLILRRSKYFKPEYRVILKNVGRYQTRQEKKLSKIKFLPGEGVVGNSYSIGEIIIQDTIKFTKEREDEYYLQHLNNFGLPQFKSKKLHDKSCSFIACPIKFFKSDEIFGVIVVDCLEPKELNTDEFRTIEKVVENYTVFFNSNNI